MSEAFEPLEIARIRPDIVGDDRLSPVMIDVGLVSRNKQAVVGLDGHIFLYRGSNDVMALYEAGATEEALDWGDRWIDVVVKRAAFCRENGCAFVQFVIPEKSTLLPEKFPFRVKTPTATFARMEDGLLAASRADSSPWYFSALRLMAAHPRRLEMFGRTDSHCTTLGTILLLQQAVTAALGDTAGRYFATWPSDLLSAKGKVIAGALSRDFFGHGLREHVSDISTELRDRLGGPEIAYVFVPENGGHLGNIVVFRNPDAPFDNKVVAFSNSFFERGARPDGLSWWFARLFREFHFVWTPKLDYDYVKAVQPDVVVCQTIERFLNRPPGR